MDAGIMGLLAVLLPLVAGTLGLAAKINKAIQNMDERLAKIESILIENKR